MKPSSRDAYSKAAIYQYCERCDYKNKIIIKNSYYTCTVCGVIVANVIAPSLVAHSEIGNYAIKNNDSAGTLAAKTKKPMERLERGVMRLIELEHADLLPNERAKSRAIQNAVYVLSETPEPRKVRKKKMLLIAAVCIYDALRSLNLLKNPKKFCLKVKLKLSEIGGFWRTHFLHKRKDGMAWVQVLGNDTLNVLFNRTMGDLKVFDRKKRVAIRKITFKWWEELKCRNVTCWPRTFLAAAAARMIEEGILQADKNRVLELLCVTDATVSRFKKNVLSNL